jgi:Helix-turn-helix domain of resolvase
VKVLIPDCGICVTSSVSSTLNSRKHRNVRAPNSVRRVVIHERSSLRTLRLSGTTERSGVCSLNLKGDSPGVANAGRVARPASIDATKVRELKAQGLGASEIAKALKIGRASVYRVLEAGSEGRNSCGNAAPGG